MKKRPAMKTMLKIPSSKSEKAPSRVVCLSQFPSNVVDVWLQPRIRDIAGHAVLMATASINIISDDVALTYEVYTEAYNASMKKTEKMDLDWTKRLARAQRAGQEARRKALQ